ncbi:Indoleamine 2,3-dioxygenase [Aspergillus coremiiformis]|uniref:Indoleamine 2,3-dioxygenase n=1 Tax=Aspergillus coremiiformis TaxID=138285 RepID=A0A5N6ZEN3_9EURO|nr:Indoleamine 2,3-dioxygenase [Aspergillus coremiiformis]
MPGLQRITLEDYQISPQFGFLPQQPPLKQLQDPYYEIWEEMMSRLPLQSGDARIREDITNMPVLATARLVTEPEWRRAYVVLTFLSQIYIWGDHQPCNKLPRSLAVPLLDVSQHLQISPCATFAGFCLWNISPVSHEDHRPYDLENLKSINSFTGTKDEEWFFGVSAAIESIGGCMIVPMLHAMEAARDRRSVAVTDFLENLATCLEQIGSTLDRLYDQCSPSVFYHHFRRFLKGSPTVQESGLSQGVFYEGEDGTGEWHQYPGGSNAQSSLIQLFDIVLGIDQSAAMGGNPKGSFHKEMQRYMPGPHREFLELMARICNIRSFVLGHDPSSNIRHSYDRAITNLAIIRQKHLIMASREAAGDVAVKRAGQLGSTPYVEN